MQMSIARTILLISLLTMITGFMLSLRVAGLAEDKETHKLSNLYYIPAWMFWSSFPINLVVFIWNSNMVRLSFGDVTFYIALIIFLRETWIARKQGKNAVEYIDSLTTLKKNIVLLLFFYLMYWLIQGIIIVITKL